MLKISQHRPGGPVVDRTLESFSSVLLQLQQQVKAVMDEKAKQELNQVIVPFVQQVNVIIDKYKNGGIGFKNELA